MIAELITIGDEILIGQIVDTNSAWIAENLNLIGIPVNRIVSISDSKSAIQKSIDEAFINSDIVIITGGLGPTNDDITKSTLNEYFKGNLAIHQPTLEHVSTIFKSRGLGLTELNRKQAEVPDCCVVLQNKLGTAPGMWFENEGKILISLPGVPFEMAGLMKNEVLPRLSKLITNQVVVHRTIQTFGLPESYLAEKLTNWENQLPKQVKLAYLPSPTSIRLRLSAYGAKGANLFDLVEGEVKKLYQVIPSYIYGEGEVSLQEVIGRLLKLNNASLSTAESCTGGAIAHLITQVPGSSEYFKGSVVAYSNTVKEELLGVNPDIIKKNGAVSKSVVEAMAKGVKEKLKTDYAIAVSGIAGPDGGTVEKPVGTVWIAIASNKSLFSKEIRFTSDRTQNIIRSTATALNMLRLILIDENI
ncbi:MAG: competence/damage-inducible protein A [Bacteroidales bacterium]|nr:MAG: competence/damage-inducible protein A [Bacteroidales bacterium]